MSVAIAATLPTAAKVTPGAKNTADTSSSFAKCLGQKIAHDEGKIDREHGKSATVSKGIGSACDDRADNGAEQNTTASSSDASAAFPMNAPVVPVLISDRPMIAPDSGLELSPSPELADDSKTSTMGNSYDVRCDSQLLAVSSPLLRGEISQMLGANPSPLLEVGTTSQTVASCFQQTLRSGDTQETQLGASEKASDAALPNSPLERRESQEIEEDPRRAVLKPVQLDNSSASMSPEENLRTSELGGSVARVTWNGSRNQRDTSGRHVEAAPDANSSNRGDKPSEISTARTETLAAMNSARVSDHSRAATRLPTQQSGSENSCEPANSHSDQRSAKVSPARSGDGHDTQISSSSPLLPKLPNSGQSSHDYRTTGGRDDAREPSGLEGHDSRPVASGKELHVDPIAPEIKSAEQGQNASMDPDAHAAVPAETSSAGWKPPSNSPRPDARPVPVLPETTPPTFAGTVHLARVVERLGQSEMHIGLQTSSFGNVEVHTIVRDTLVGLSFASEKGDLRSVVAPEMRSLESHFREHELRLESLQFADSSMSTTTGQGSGGGPDPNSYRPTNAFARISQGSHKFEETTLKLTKIARPGTALSVHA